MTEQVTSGREENPLAPYGRAWRKLIDAYTQKIRSLPDGELADLIDASTAAARPEVGPGAALEPGDPDEYFSSFEVRRIALAEQVKRATLSSKV